MMNNFLILLVLSIMLLVPSQTASSAGSENYQYEALPVGDRAGKEITDMEVLYGSQHITLLSRTHSHTLEEISIQTDLNGQLLSAVKRLSDHDGTFLGQTRIWRDGGKAYLIQDDKAKEKSFDIPRDTPLAVEGSLLILMRYFSFNTGEERQVFMIDFSGQTVKVTCRQAGVEKMTVPAGAYDCYRIEVVVNIPLLKPKILFWISKTPPHFLVKSIGKRGFFSPSYDTSLLSVK